MSLREGYLSTARLPTLFERPGIPPGGPPYLDSCLAIMYLSWLACMIGLCPSWGVPGLECLKRNSSKSFAFMNYSGKIFFCTALIEIFLGTNGFS